MSIFTGLAERTARAYTAFRTPVPLAVANPPVPEQKSRKDGGGGGAVSAFLSGGDGGYYHTRSARALAMAGYMANPTVFRAVNILADVCASIPLEVTTGITKKVVQDNHPLSLLLQSPNLDQPGMSFRKWLISYWIIAGTSYIYGPTLGNKPAPTAWYLLRPDLVSIMFRPDLSVYYRYQIGAKIFDYDPVSMLVNKFFDPMDELHGVSPLLVAAAVIDRQNEGELFNLSLMKHAALPSGALVAPGALTDDSYDHLKDQVRQQYEGSENAGRVYLLEGGLTFTQMSMSPKDADWLGGDANAGRKIAMAIGVDPLLLNDKEHSTYNNVEQARTALIDLSAIPIMSLMLDGMNVYAQARYSTDVAIRMNQKYLDMLRGDKQATSIMMISEWNAGPRSFNETREGLGLDQVEGGDFHKLGPTTYVNQADLPDFMEMHTARRNAPPIIGPPLPTALTPATSGVQLALPTAASAPAPALPAAGKPLVLPAAGGSGAGKGHALPSYTNQTPRRVSGKRMLVYTPSRKSADTWATDMETALSSFFADEKMAIFTCLNRATTLTQAKHLIDAALVLHLDTLGALFAHYYQKAGEAQAVDIAQAFKRQPIILFTKEAVPGYADYAASRGAMVYDTTKAKVGALLASASEGSLENGALQANFASLYDDFSASRSPSIARTEMRTASNLGMYTAAASLALPIMKTWQATGDNRTRPSHLEAHGQTQPLSVNFIIGDEDAQLAFPGDSSQGAGIEEIADCRCTFQLTLADGSSEDGYNANMLAGGVA